MENNINSKNNINLMNKIFTIMLLLCLTLFSVNAVSEHELLRWEFETCSGSIVFDTSGNNNNGIMQNGAKFSTSRMYNGLCSSEFDGSNDFIAGLTAQDTPNQITASFWLYPKMTNKWYAFEISDTYETFEFEYSGATNKLELGYYNDSLVYTHYDLETYAVPKDAWIHFVIAIDTDTNKINYWRNGVQKVNNITMVDGINKFASIKTLKLAANKDSIDFYQGNIDSFRMFDFIPTQTQVTNLYNTNSITLVVDDVIVNDGINQSTNNQIITSITPNNLTTNVSNFNSIEVTLNHIANCDLYLDNTLIESYNNVLAFNYPLIDLLEGDYEFFTYCSYMNNATLVYEVSETNTFTIVKPSKTIQFYMYDSLGAPLTNFDDLYLVTPCFKDTELNKYNIPDKEFYIQPLVNGQANFNLSYDSTFEFCMLKGKVNAKDDFFSLNYDLPQVDKQTELGDLFITNSTYTYSLKVDDMDLYKPTQPEFWGKTWSALFQLVIGIILGALLIVLGLMAGVDKLIIVGGLIIAIGMGVSFTTFVGAIL